MIPELSHALRATMTALNPAISQCSNFGTLVGPSGVPKPMLKPESFSPAGLKDVDLELQWSEASPDEFCGPHCHSISLQDPKRIRYINDGYMAIVKFGRTNCLDFLPFKSLSVEFYLKLPICLDIPD